MAAEPVSPDVAPRTARRPSLEPVERKYSKKLPSIWRATSLKANVGPWNNSCAFGFVGYSIGLQFDLVRCCRMIISRTNEHMTCCIEPYTCNQYNTGNTQENQLNSPAHNDHQP